MKKFWKRFLTVVLILVLLVGGLCLWQWDNILALKTSLEYSREDLSAKLDENKEKVQNVADRVDGVTVRDLTEEEKAALRDGLMDRDELLDRLTGKEEPGPAQQEPEASPAPSQDPAGVPSEAPSQAPAEAPSEVPSQAPSSAPPEPASDPNRDQLSAYLAEIYLMKEEYTLLLENMYANAIAEYQALPDEERTTAAKYTIGLRYMNEALAREDECDAKMAELEKKIYDLLVILGEDTSLVDEIQTMYEEEKELKKAYYLGLHD